jgi:hypothetical protein
VLSAYPTNRISNPQNKAVILRAFDFFAFAQKRSLSLEKAVVDGEGVPAVPTTAFTLDNGPLPFNNPLLFVIPSEAEGSAVRHSGALNLPFHNHFPFVILSGAQDDVWCELEIPKTRIL